MHTQWADSADEVMEAVDMCPVDCISYVSRQQVLLLCLSCFVQTPSFLSDSLQAPVLTFLDAVIVWKWVA